MLGWKAKIGLITPSGNVNMEPYFNLMVPKGVAVNSARVKLGEEVTPKTLDQMIAGVDRAAGLLADAKPDIIIFGCTAGSLLKGKGYNKQIIQRIRKASGGIRSTTTSTAVINALNQMALKTIGIATPYINEINELEKAFFVENGFEVVEIRGLEIKEHKKISWISPYKVYRLASSIYRDNPEVNGLFVSCTSLRSPEVIENLEQFTGKPVVTSLQASVWECLRKIGINERVNGYGKLLKEY